MGDPGIRAGAAVSCAHAGYNQYTSAKTDDIRQMDRRLIISRTTYVNLFYALATPNSSMDIFTKLSNK